MLPLIVLLASLQAPVDTITIDSRSAFERAVDLSPTIAAAKHRAEAARGRAEQADALPNPALNVNAENLGKQEALTGSGGFEGTEGQAVFTTPLPFGWERSGRRGVARAMADGATAEARLAEVDATLEVVHALGIALRDQTMVEGALEENRALTRFAEVLALQAREGRAASGDAARAELARGMSATRLARLESALASSMTDLARRLGYGPDAWVSLTAPVCSNPIGAGAEADDPVFPEVAVATARAAAAESEVTLQQGLRLPDILPQIGVRRSGGLSALFLGVSTTLPLFDRGSKRVDAARADQRAADTELAATEAVLGARAIAATRSLTALERAGKGFTDEWFAALDQTVTAAQARFDLGEGTLFELLDSRRARIQALDDYATWQAEWWHASAAAARLHGRTIDPTLLCTEPFRETR